MRWVVAAVVAWSMGIGGLGAFAAYEVFNRTAIHAAPAVVVSSGAESTQRQGPDASSAVVMPDVVGLAQESALEAIGDAGADPTSVAVKSTPNAAAAGTVVGQDPVGGATQFGGVTLTVAAPATMPKLVGEAVDAATAALAPLGVVPQVKLVYARGRQVGTVIATVPGAGARLVPSVMLQVASAPSAVFLADLEATTSSCSSGTQTLGNRPYEHSVYCNAYSSPRDTTWVLGGRADALVATAGLAEGSDRDAAATLDIIGNTRVLQRIPLKSGVIRTLTISLGSLQRLTVRVTSESGAVVVLGDAKVVGSAANIDALSR